MIASLRETVLEQGKRAVTIGGKPYQVPRLGKIDLMIEADREPWIDGAFRFALNTGPGLFVDVGVNRGQTLAKVLKLDPDRAYLGFEPQPSCVHFVTEFLRLNGLDGHRIVPVGLSDETRITRIWHRANNHADAAASIVEDFRPDDFYAESACIIVTTGDAALAALEGTDDIGVIKIDVEGAEYKAMCGLAGTIEAHRPIVIFEVLNNIVAATGDGLTPEQLAVRTQLAQYISDFFRERDYTVYNIREGRFVPVDPITPGNTRDMSITNYLAAPRALRVPGAIP